MSRNTLSRIGPAEFNISTAEWNYMKIFGGYG